MEGSFSSRDQTQVENHEIVNSKGMLGRSD